MPARTVHATEGPLLTFVVVFVGVVAATTAAWQTAPELRDRVKNIAAADRPPDDSYLAHDRGGHVDHHVLFFGTDAEALDHMRRARVLFVGNSRLMFALQARVARPFFDQLGLPFYALGFGFNEGDRFPLGIIERHDLRPDVVVVNVDGFFGMGLSEWAHQVVIDTPFGARKRLWEAEAAHTTRRVVHQVVPNWIDLFGRPGFDRGGEFIAYRSRRDGTWTVSPWPRGTTLVSPPPLDEPPLGEGEIASAHRFAEALARRGARLVLTSVPAPTRAGGGPAVFASLLDAPLVAPPSRGYTTYDGSHLSEASALEWARALMADLEPHLPTAPDRRP